MLFQRRGKMGKRHSIHPLWYIYYAHVYYIDKNVSKTKSFFIRKNVSRSINEITYRRSYFVDRRLEK